MNNFKKHPFLYSILVSIIAGFILNPIINKDSMNDTPFVFAYIVCSLIIAVFAVYPIMMTLLSILFTILPIKDPDLLKIGKDFRISSLYIVAIYTLLFLCVSEINFTADWMVTLKNEAIHTPIFTKSYPTLITIFIVGLIGYCILSLVSINKLPPLIITICFASIYAVMIECILFIVQIIGLNLNSFLCLLPVNIIVLCFNLMKKSIIQWNNSQHTSQKVYASPLLNKFNHLLINSKNWPILGFLFMIPLLIIMIAILVLFGQQPDAAIKAWTETSEWNLSTQVSPPNIIPEYNGHYLCTVAARGDKKLVKPIRLGIRNNHLIIVNRQLCVANAFEQILEEKTPHIHKYVRHFYDTYGLPLAKMIHTPLAADIVYIIMKPLEWFFLIVLYLCDVNPENRIAVQYIRNNVN